MSYVSNKFIRNILQEPPKWGPIGQIVYLRTYSRWLQDQGRREHWGETVRRVADYSVTLDPTMTEQERVIEAEKLFETIYQMRAFPAGRTLWVGGTEHSKTHGQSQFNCSFANINSLDDLHDIVILLMNGVGVGVGVRTEEVDRFASQGTLNLNKQVVVKDYEYIGTPGTGGTYDKSDGSAYYTIHDSREGWAEFVRDFLGELLFSQDVHTIYVNLDHIRPEGTPLKTFGGRASGPKAVIDFIDGILQITHGMTKINDIFLLDTANMLGRMVVAGGTRRCYPSGTIVKTTDGPIEIQNVKVGMKISTPKGEKSVTNVFDQGVQKTIAVNHTFGSFHCTPNHRVAVFTSINEWEFKEAQYLTPEDRLVWDFEPIPGTPQRLPTLEVVRTYEASYVRNAGRAVKSVRYPDVTCSVDGCSRGSATLNGPHGALCNAHYLRLKKYGDALKFRGWGRDVNLPEYIDTDLAWLVGYIHGNGHVMKISDSKGRLSISCPTDRPEIIEKAAAMLTTLCPDSKTTVRQGDGNWVNIMVSNARLVSWLYEYVKRPSEDITIPSFIAMAEPEIRAAYLAGVFDSDGSIHKHNFNAVDTIHEGFANSIAKLYMTLGIGASVKRRERKEEGWSDISRVSIIGSEFKEAAHVALRPYASTKLQDSVLNCRGSNTLTFKPKQSMSAGVPSGRASANSGNMSPAAVLEYTDVSLIAYPVPVISTTEGVTAQTWDIEVEDIHQFTAEGFVTHNSALIALGDSKSVDFENAKIGDWSEHYPWREQANNSKVYYSKPSKESIREGFKKILQYGEPGFINGNMAKSIRRDWAGLNPCFTGDMRLLTEDGWVTFKDAYEHGRPLKILQDSRVTYEGEGEEKDEHWKIDPENTDLPVITQASHVFLTRKNADIVKLEFVDGTVLRCTPDHLIATTIGMVEARNLTKYHDVLAHRVARCDRIANSEPETVEQHKAFALGAIAASGSTMLKWIKLWGMQSRVQASIKAAYGEELKEDTHRNISKDEVKRLTGYKPIDLLDSAIPEWISSNADDKVGSWFIRGFLSMGLKEPRYPSKDESYFMEIEEPSIAFLDSLKDMLWSRGISSEFIKTRDCLFYTPTSLDDPGYYGTVYTIKINSDIDIYMDAIGLTFSLPDYKSSTEKPRLKRLKSITPDGVEDVYCIKENTRRTLIVEGIVARRCAEILLSDKGFCNLVTTNLKYFAEHDNDEQMLKDTVEIITRHNLRITNTTIHGVSPEWDIVQKRDRLLGASFTGYGDHADILGEDVSLATLGKMRKWVREEANNYADKMGIPHPLLATTVKPEGTITLLYGASSGIHDAFSPYYIRRVRMSRTDALAVVLAKMGVPVEDAINAPQTVVFSFPVKTAAKQAASKKSAVEQLERYKNIMQTYVDHNASNTIYIDESEVDEVADWLHDNWDSYVAVSFLAKFGQYAQAPMEEIDEETYNKLAAQMPDLSDLHARLAEVEYEMSAGDELEGCDVGGSCPIR